MLGSSSESGDSPLGVAIMLGSSSESGDSPLGVAVTPLVICECDSLDCSPSCKADGMLGGKRFFIGDVGSSDGMCIESMSEHGPGKQQ